MSNRLILAAVTLLFIGTAAGAFFAGNIYGYQRAYAEIECPPMPTRPTCAPTATVDPEMRVLTAYYVYISIVDDTEQPVDGGSLALWYSTDSGASWTLHMAKESSPGGYNQFELKRSGAVYKVAFAPHEGYANTGLSVQQFLWRGGASVYLSVPFRVAAVTATPWPSPTASETPTPSKTPQPTLPIDTPGPTIPLPTATVPLPAGIANQIVEAIAETAQQGGGSRLHRLAVSEGAVASVTNRLQLSIYDGSEYLPYAVQGYVVLCPLSMSVEIRAYYEGPGGELGSVGVLP